MTLKHRIAKLRLGNPLFTIAGLVEITLYGDSQERDGDFLKAAAQVLHCSQAEVDEAIAFTGETAVHFAQGEIALTEDGRIPFDDEAAVAAGYHSPAFIQMFLGWMLAKLPTLAQVDESDVPPAINRIEPQQLLDLFADFEAEMRK
jgi:hypothetical protein